MSDTNHKDILRRIPLNKIKRWPTMKRFLAGRLVRIWSHQWDAWWRPGGYGYTAEKLEAGIWAFEDALKASAHAGKEKQIEFERVD